MSIYYEMMSVFKLSASERKERTLKAAVDIVGEFMSSAEGKE